MIPAFLLNPRVLVALVIAATGAALVGYAWWWHTSEVRQAVRAERTALTARVEAERARRYEEVSHWLVEMTRRDLAARARYDKLAAERREIFITLKREVPIYVTPLADSRCIVPHGFVRFHDSAAAARPAADPGTPGGPLDADSGIALSTVAATVAENYAACHDAIAEVRRWREWYADLRAKWDELLATLNSKEKPQ